MNFEALRVSSSGTAISRFKFQLGIDKSNPRDGQLTDPPDQIITNIDNSNASNEVLIASVSFGTTSPEDVIAHAEVYQGSGTTPVWSETWHSGQSAYGF